MIVNGTTTVNGTLTANTSTVEPRGDWASNAGTVTFSGAGLLTFSNNTAVQNVAFAGTETLRGVTVNKAGGSVTVTFDGAPVQQGPHWKYDPVVNQIIIVKQPHNGAKIKVCYKS